MHCGITALHESAVCRPVYRHGAAFQGLTALRQRRTDMGNVFYQEAAGYVLDLPLHTKKNSFEETKAFYHWLGGPGSMSNVIHVAGTNGKGSVCAYVESVLNAAGYRVGMFTSPHLTDIRERLLFQGSMIGEEEFAAFVEQIREKKAGYKGGAFQPAFFETLFFIFMLWMEEKKPDFIILETGIGGRLDVTNVISRPFVTVITKIALDHCEYLGNTTDKIAEEKAGIMKQNVPAVCLETDKGTTAVFLKKARELSVPLTIVSKNEVTFSKSGKNKIDFFIQSAYYKYIEAVLSTGALYQAQNAALAVRVLELIGRSFELSKAQIEKGLSSMQWEARMEEVLPGIVLDGANNPDGIQAFLESVAQDGCQGRRFLLFGALSDKSAAMMAGLLWNSGLFDGAAFTCIRSRRSLTYAQLVNLTEGMAGSSGKIRFFGDSEGAVCYLAQEKKEADRIYITGSLYLAGEIKCCIRKDMEVSHDQF